MENTRPTITIDQALRAPRGDLADIIAAKLAEFPPRPWRYADETRIDDGRRTPPHGDPLLEAARDA